MSGFGYLIDKVSTIDLAKCTTLVPLVAKPLLLPLNQAIMEVHDKTSPENLESGQMPELDRAKIHEITDLLDLLADLFKGF